MIHPTFEFFVFDSIPGERFRVAGCCGDIPIRVGDTFDALYRHKPYRNLGYYDPPVRDVEIPVSIRVVGIFAINRDLLMLGQGMTGYLTIEGEGIEDITSGWILGLRSPSPVPQNGTNPVVEEAAQV